MADNQRLLELALKGLELERERIQKEIADLKSRLSVPPGTASETPASPATPRKKGTISEAGRKAISEALKKRWAERRKAKKLS